MTDQKYKLVPVEPTAEMTAAALDVLPPPLHRLKTVNVDAAIRHAIAAAPNPFGLHPSTAHLASKFSEALAEKLAAAEAKYGYSDEWSRPGWVDECREKLREHLAKGDPRDVAAYCAFLWHHGESTAAPDLARKYRLVYDFSEDVGHENGDYECECAACGRHFLGHKRRVLCRLCSTTPAPEPVCRWPSIRGVSRDGGNEKFLLVSFSRRPTDDEMRALHDVLAGHDCEKPQTPEPICRWRKTDTPGFRSSCHDVFRPEDAKSLYQGDRCPSCGKKVEVEGERPKRKLQ